MKVYGKIAILLLSLLLVLPAQAGKKKKKKKKSANPATVHIPKKGEEGEAELIFVNAVGFYLAKKYDKALDNLNKAERIEPSNDVIKFYKARCYAQVKDITKAINFGKKAIQLNPKNENYYLFLIDLYHATGLKEQEALTYKLLLINTPKQRSYFYSSAYAWVELADKETERIKVVENNTKEFRKMIEKIDFYYQESIESINLLEKTFEKTDKSTEVKQEILLYLQKTEEAYQEGLSYIANNPLNLEFIYSQGQRFYKYFPKESFDLIRRASTKNPLYTNFHLLLHDFYNQQNQVNDAIKELTFVFQQSDLSLERKIKIVESYIDYHDSVHQKAAIQFTDLLIKQYPEQEDPYLLLGDIHLHKQNYQEARIAYLEGTKIKKSLVLWEHILQIDNRFIGTDTLLKDVQQAVDKLPNESILWLHYGFANIRADKYDKAINGLEKGKNLSNDEKLKYEFNKSLGDAYAHIKSYSKSDAAYEEALSFNPNDPYILNNYSYFLSLRSENLEFAQSMCKKLLRIAPLEPAYQDTYGWVLYKLGDYEKAKKWIGNALLNTKDGTITEHYGDILFQLGDIKNAVFQWQKAKQAGKGSEFLEKKIIEGKLYE